MDLTTDQAPDAQSSGSFNVLPDLLSEIASNRARIGALAQPLQLEIPGYRGKVAAKFRWIPVKELSATARSLQKIKDPTQQNIAACADTLVATCDEILIKVGEDQWESLTFNGEPVTFATEGLSVAFKYARPKTSRDNCIAFFSNEYALVDVTQKVVAWLEDTNKEVDEEHLGES